MRTTCGTFLAAAMAVLAAAANEGGHTPQNAHFTGLSAISTL